MGQQTMNIHLSLRAENVHLLAYCIHVHVLPVDVNHIRSDNRVTNEKTSAPAGNNRGKNRGPRRRPATENKEACAVALQASGFFLLQIYYTCAVAL